MRYDISNDDKEIALALDWDIYYGVFSREGNYFIVAANVDARTELMMFDAATMEQIQAHRSMVRMSPMFSFPMATN